MVSIHVDVYGDTVVERRLLGIETRAEDFTPAFEAIHGAFLEIEKRQFDSEGSASGAPWSPLKESTLKRKETRGEDPRILRATEDLMRSFTDAGDKNHVAIINPGWAWFGSAMEYAKYHQSDEPRRVLPQRKIINFTETERTGITKTFQAHLMGSATPAAELVGEA